MTSKRGAGRLTAVLLLAWLLIGSIVAVARAQEENVAAIIVRVADDRILTRCVSFAEEQISGMELLERSGLDVQAGHVGMGAQICSVAGAGCPASDCFCQCAGGADCVYWSYWRQAEGRWQYASLGAASTLVSDGQVDGWSWGPGTVAEAIEPPPVRYEELCPAGGPTSRPTGDERDEIGGRPLPLVGIGIIVALAAAAAIAARMREGARE
jgi:hypothetical protein